MSAELKKRIITSFLLVSLLILMFFYTYILIVSLIIVGVISWIEFYSLTSKIFLKTNRIQKILKFLLKAISLIYITSLIYLIVVTQSKNPELYIFIVFSISIAIMSDVGGLIIGNIFKGKKLSKISPKKTISGSLGSFIFSLLLIPIFLNHLAYSNIIFLLIITLLISLSSQLGDLFISFLKRKASVKNTSDLLPGHGGVLDRIDGIIFAIPIGFLLLNYL
jgi:phosphatidate cytidylyltransferase